MKDLGEMPFTTDLILEMKTSNYTEFLETLEDKAPPSSWQAPLQALWWEAKGDWQAAHDIVERLPSNEASHIHAYLHRKEGDDWNARYWYRVANKPFPTQSMQEELKILVENLL